MSGAKIGGGRVGSPTPVIAVTDASSPKQSAPAGEIGWGAHNGLSNAMPSVVLETPATNYQQRLAEGDKGLAALYRQRPVAQLVGEIQAHKYPRGALVFLLQGQNEARGAGPAVLANIKKLESEDTVAVVTGQQVGLLGGPGYSLYKALGAVHEANRLSAQGTPAVPVFWMASYDHDHQEVEVVSLLDGAHDPEVLTLGGSRPDRVPVGNQKLGDEVEAFLGDMQARFPELSGEVVDKLKEHYNPEATFAEAFAGFMGWLTDDLGLVFVDPSDPAFAAMARPVIEQELFGPGSVAEHVADASAKLTDLGLSPQIGDRGERLALFFIDDNGHRVALTKTDDGFATEGVPAILDEATARRLADTAPHRFSPSALLRPAFEDAVFPTVGYVAGPSEQKYFAQIGGVYEWLGLPMPQVLSRPKFAVVDGEDAGRIAESTGVSMARLLLSDDASAIVSKDALGPGVDAAYASFDASATQLQDICDSLEASLNAGAQSHVLRQVADLKKNLGLRTSQLRSVIAGNERLEKGLDHFESQLDRHFEGITKSIEAADPSSGRSPSYKPMQSLGKAIGSLSKQRDKAARQAAADSIGVLNRIRPRGKGWQEREISVGQLVGEHGKEIVAELAKSSAVDQAGIRLVFSGGER